jgi:hypothetical protein
MGIIASRSFRGSRTKPPNLFTHAQLAGEMITHLAACPSFVIGRLLDSHQHDIGKILVESMEHEAAALALYKELLSAVEGRSVMLEEYARPKNSMTAKWTRCFASRARSVRRDSAPSRVYN